MRSIDADALLREWQLECGGSCFVEKGRYCMHYDRTKGICTLIVKAPTIEAEPIRHGKWIYIRDEENNGLYECSECHKSDIHAKACKVSYCWNCGAKMDEVEE